MKDKSKTPNKIVRIKFKYINNYNSYKWTKLKGKYYKVIGSMYIYISNMYISGEIIKKKTQLFMLISEYESKAQKTLLETEGNFIMIKVSIHL